MIRIVLAWLLILPAFGQSKLQLEAVGTIADLTARFPNGLERVQVSGYHADGDWGSPRVARHEPGSTLATNLGCVFMPVEDVGRWVFDDCESGVIDPRWFGTKPYFPPTTHTPWGGAEELAAIGTADFSIWVRAKFPSFTTTPIGLFTLSRATNWATEFDSSLEFRASDQVFGFVFRGTNGSSSIGSSTAVDAAILDATGGNTFGALSGTTADIVVTRSGANASVWINGVDVSAQFTLQNPAGWAKSLALGELIRSQIGNNGNPFFWPEPIIRFAVFNRVLVAGDMANLSGAAGKILDYVPADTTLPDDCSPGIQASIDYLSSASGGTVVLPDGYYRVDSTIRLKPLVTVKGASRPPFYGPGDKIMRMKGAAMMPWYDSTNDVFLASHEDCVSDYLDLRQFGAWGAFTVKSMSAGVEMLNFVGMLASSSRAIVADRVGTLAIRDNTFVRMPSYWLASHGLHGSSITENRGQTLRGMLLFGSNDIDVMQNFVDGTFGPGAYLRCNTTALIKNHFEHANNPAQAQSFDQAITVDAGTDVFTTVRNHRFHLGDIVRFKPYTTSDVLPAPLNTAFDYFVLPISATTFKVNTVYCDDYLGTGVVYGQGMDITSVGTGTSWVSAGPQCGVVLNSSDGVTMLGNRFALSWQEGLRLEYSRGNEIVGNNLPQNWYQNSAATETNRAAISLIGSSDNTFVGNRIDRRLTDANANIGIYVDSTSLWNTFVGNSRDANNVGGWSQMLYDGTEKYSTRINGDESVFPYGLASTLYVPASTTYPVGSDSTADHERASAAYYNPTYGYWFINSDSGTNWFYGPMVNRWAPTQWLYNQTSGTLQGANVTTSDALISLSSPYSQEVIRASVSSATPSAGVRFTMYRNAGSFDTNGVVSYAPIPSGGSLGSFFFGGWYGTNSASVTAGAAEIEAVASQAWSVGTNGTSFNFKVAQNNTSTRVTQVKIRQDGRLTLTPQNANPTFDISSGDIYMHSTNGLTQRRVGVWETLVGTTNYPTANGAYVLFVTNGVASWIAHP